MAEFRYDCYRKYVDRKARKKSLVISDEEDLCEGCGEYRQTVVEIRSGFF